MAAIITDQLRITNAKKFVDNVRDQDNSFYVFVGLPNANDYDPNWDQFPPSPSDSFYEENSCWDSMIALKRLSSDDVRQVVRKEVWRSGTTYDMYRHDISINSRASRSGSSSLYSSNYYVMNSDYRVYICLYNGISPEYPTGRPSLDEPTFVDLEPREAGTSGDGYIWKYLYTISPREISKFDSTDFMPIPVDWETNSQYAPIRQNALNSGQIKIITILDRGVGLGTAGQIYTRVPVLGDGEGAEATVTIDNESKVSSVTVSKGGSGYTFGTLDLTGRVPTGTSQPSFKVIIPPQNGHGYDVQRELGATNVLLYTRLDNDSEDYPDFIIGNQIAKIGIVENPKAHDSNDILKLPRASAVPALKLTGIGYDSTTFPQDSFITQTIGVGQTSVGRVISYDQTTGVLKYWQDKSMCGFNTDGSQNSSPLYGFNLNKFTANVANPLTQLFITGETSSALQIDVGFGRTSNPGVSTVINNRTYYMGQSFINGIAQPEVEKYTGKIIYVDNRPSITRSTTQKEDIKIILQF